MAITRTPITNDDGSGTVGTVWENGWKTELYNQIDAALAQPLGTLAYGSYVQIPSFSGVVSNWNPAGSANAIVWYLSNAAAGAYITGIVAAPVGTVHVLVNGGQAVNISNAHAGSAAANQFICPGYADYVLNSWYSVPILYSVYGKWLVLKPT